LAGLEDQEALLAALNGDRRQLLEVERVARHG
jgi:hypothetical protein